MTRKLFVAVFVANLALIVVSLFVLPPTVAIHFGPGGDPNNWASREVNALIFLALTLVLFVQFSLVPWLTFKFPRRLINLPNKEYWLSEENRPKAKAMLTGLLSEFGVGLLAFIFFMLLLVLDANLASPVRLKERLFFPAFAAFMVYTAYWCVRVFRSFRLPKVKTPA